MWGRDCVVYSAFWKENVMDMNLLLKVDLASLNYIRFFLFKKIFKLLLLLFFFFEQDSICYHILLKAPRASTRIEVQDSPKP
jgi:hypothetical protein